MTIICLIIVNNSGDLLFARQFIHKFSKTDLFLQSLIFIKTYNLYSNINYFENYGFRYIFQILKNDLFLVMITTINSNLIMDIKCMKLSSRILSDLCNKEINKEIICKKGIEFALYLDEIFQYKYIVNTNSSVIKSNINNIVIDENIIKEEKTRIQSERKQELIRKFQEYEKLERFKSEEKGSSENHIFDHHIKLNYEFKLVKLNKPIKFKTPSGKVVLLSERKKNNNSLKKIKGLKL